MECPRCTTNLTAMDTPLGPTVDFCPSCHGIWFDPGEVESFLTLGDSLPGLETIPAEAGKPGPSCPSCEGKMAELEYPPGEALHLDLCEGCGGVWLDRGEVEALRKAVESAAKRRQGPPGFVFTPVREDPDAATAEEPAKTPAKEPTRGEREGEIEPPEEAGAEGDAPRVVPVVNYGAVSGPAAITWGWVVVGAVVMLAVQAVTAVLVAGSVYAIDKLGSQGFFTRTSMVISGGLLSYLVGGFVVGWKSPGRTVLEPALAAIPSGLCFALLFSQAVGGWRLGAFLVGGFLVAFVGAWLGERYQDW